MSSPHRTARPPRDFFEVQRRQRRRTAVLIAVEFVLVWTIANVLVFPAHLRDVCSSTTIASNGLIERTCSTEWHVDLATSLTVALFVALFLIASVFVARWRALAGDALHLAEGPDSAVLRDVVEQMAIASGMPVPAMFLIEDDALNAYAVAGRRRGAIVCTTGLLAALDRRELTGVVAHEMAHLRNRDSTVVWTATFAVGLVVALAGLAILFAERGAHRRAGEDDAGRPRRAMHLSELDQEARDRSGWRMLATAFAMVMWLLARPAALLVRAAISRRREQLADASAVQFTRDPTGLRAALEKIAGSAVSLRDVGFVTSSLWIDAPVEPGAHGWLARLLDSHPPNEQRIAWLRSLERSGTLWTDLAPV